MIRSLLLGIALLVTAFIAQLAPPAGGRASASTQFVTITDNKYTPQQIVVNAGDTVEWDFNGTNQHTVSSTSAEAFDSGMPMSSGTFTHTFNTAGTFTYLCGVHGAAMSGSVVVQQAAAPTDTPVPPTSTAVPPTNTALPATSTPVTTATPAAATMTPVPATNTPASTAVAGTPARASTPPASGAPSGASVLPKSGGGPSGAGSSTAPVALALAVAGITTVATAASMAIARRRRHPKV